MFNIPTSLTWFRILLIPLFVGVYYFPEQTLSFMSRTATANVLVVSLAPF